MSTPTLPARLLARLRSRRRQPAPMTAEQGRRLAERVTVLEAGLEESRRLNQRLADVVDVVTEVLVPAADRDDERLRQALANLNRTLDSADDGGAPD
jgi:C4-dicarboxylate-specific signal transduction histidine kinase